MAALVNNKASVGAASLTPPCRRLLESKTTQQSECKLWFLARRGRITGSKVGELLKKVSDPLPDKRKIQELVEKKRQEVLDKEYQPPTCAPTSALLWGRVNEESALVVLCSRLGIHRQQLYPAGGMCHALYPLFLSSPDGVICEKKTTYVVEVKCPFTYRRCDLRYSRPEWLVLNKETGHCHLSEDHAYYWQCQSHLAVWHNATACYFTVWTPLSLHYETIYRSPAHQTKLTNLLREM